MSTTEKTLPEANPQPSAAPSRQEHCWHRGPVSARNCSFWLPENARLQMIVAVLSTITEPSRLGGLYTLICHSSAGWRSRPLEPACRASISSGLRLPAAASRGRRVEELCGMSFMRTLIANPLVGLRPQDLIISQRPHFLTPPPWRVGFNI